LLLVSAPAAAQSVEGFYIGKTLRMVIGYPPGGSNDLYARVVAKHIGRFIPGSPAVIPQNMPGAGSIVAANYMYSNAPKDGTVLAAISQGAPLDAKLGQPSAHYEPSKFGWVGRMAASANVTMVWKTSKIKTIDDVYKTEVTLGGTGAGSTVSLYPSVMNEILKTRFKMIMGYKGSAEAMLAMQRGEVEGHSTTWEAVKAVHPDWLPNGDIRVLVQHGLRRHSELADVPTSLELTKNEQDRPVMRVIMGAAEVGKSYFTTPDVPNDRLTALRRAFDAMIKDQAFINDVKQLKGEVDPMTGEDLQKLIGELDTLSPALIDRVKAIYVEK
jgi:tripartite-type tricarboxylate transporter receptor subunit TctC